MASYPLYKGTVLLEFEEKAHRYSVNGNIVPSVTSIKAPTPALVYWAAKQASDYVATNLKPGVTLDELQIFELCEGAKKAHVANSKGAAHIGSTVHDACERFAKTGVEDYPVNQEARASFETFLGWWKDHNVKVHDSEKKVYSMRFRYAGTADLFCEVDGVPCVVDLKTSNAIYDDYLMQLAAYAEARNEELDAQLYNNGWIVRLPKDGGPVETRLCDFSGLSGAMDAFLGLLTYYRWAKS